MWSVDGGRGGIGEVDRKVKYDYQVLGFCG